jgi:predicted DNA-binding transcriptional regulator AlpA
MKPTQSAIPDPLAEAAEVAAFLRMTEQNLTQMRYEKRGPRYVQLSGRSVRYRWSDVLAWVEQRTTEGDRSATPEAD